MNTLQERAKVIVDLFERGGATCVEITDSGIKVSKKEYEQILSSGSQQNQIVQLINNISTNINIDNRTIIRQVLNNIRNSESDPKRMDDAEKRLTSLLKETQKKRPKWENVKDIFKWALDFGKNVFIQLIPVLLKMNL